MLSPRLFSVASGLPFLRECVVALRANRLIAGADMGDPAQLADLRIYVPSKKAAQALRSAFVETAANHAAFLPDIRPLGEMEDSEFLRFGAAYSGGLDTAAEAEAALRAPAAIGALARQTLLARLIRPWREKLPRHIRALFGGEEINIPANTADALWLARDLAALMDEIATEDADLAKISTLAPEDLAEWWQVVTEFLQLVFAAWPQILAEFGLTAAAVRRNQSLRQEAAKIRRGNQRAGAALPLFAASGERVKPVLALGSAGSFPAAAELLHAIAYAPQGAVVLAGLDRDLDEESWNNLDKDADNPAAFAHPQYTLRRLLRRLNAERGAVQFLGAQNAPLRAREKAISEIFRPAESTERWALAAAEETAQAASAAKKPSALFSHISLIEAPTPREEALALAIALREAAEDSDKTAALITADRMLARRVSAELKRFGLTVNDSGGAPLSETEPAACLRLLVDCVFSPGKPQVLLSLLKHPLVRLGFARADLRRQTEQFELFALRGGTGRINIGAAEDFIEERLQKLTEAERVNSDFTAARLEEAQRLASALTAAAAKLYQFAAGAAEVNLAQAVAATVETLENFGRDEEGCLQRFYTEAAGQKLIGFFRALLADQADLRFMPAEWPQILAALMADETVEMRQSGRPNLFILGLFEARLQNFDTVLIGGLNEGSLPHGARSSPFMSRQMKAALGLPPPEQKIGFTAHDIAENFNRPKLILARALRADNAPAVASRWLLRLQTVAGEEAVAAMRARGAFYAQAGQKLDEAAPQPFAPRPAPAPPLALRPNKFSFTEIETLRRDPYAVYAKRILRLRPLEPLIRDAGPAERGTFIHAALAGFSQFYAGQNIAPIEAAAAKQLERIGREEFAKLQLPADIAVLWWPRFAALIPHYVEWEANLSSRQRFAELSAALTPIEDTGAFLHGRADRIDILAERGANGEKYAEIMDFKTGPNPDKKYGRLLAAPQLALEGAVLARGGFADAGAALAEALYYVRLKADGAAAAEDVSKVKLPAAAAVSAADLSEEAWQRLVRLIRHFQQPQTGYPSHALPPLNAYESDYDHLARIYEWATLSGLSGEEG